MTMTDPVADLLSRIRTAYLAKHDRLDVPASKLKLEVCRILKEQGYVESFQELDGDPVKKQLRIYLRYTPDGEPLIRSIKRISKPGRRVYKGAEEIRPVLNGLGVGIISTSLGLLTDSQARQRRVGGEVLCEVW
ncbi:MAG: 30S ribosomal protein S8 [Thermoanaerobaculia bacterium]